MTSLKSLLVSDFLTFCVPSQSFLLAQYWHRVCLQFVITWNKDQNIALCCSACVCFILSSQNIKPLYILLMLPLKEMYINQACAQTVRRYGTMSTVRTVFLKKTAYFRILTTVFYCPDGKIRYCVRYGAKLALPVQFWPQNGLSAPTPPISTSRMLLSCVDAIQYFPGRPWGWAGAASARGKGPAVACMETQSRMQYLIPG